MSSSGEGGKSTELAVATAPPPVQNVTVVNVTSSSIQLRWRSQNVSSSLGVAVQSYLATRDDGVSAAQSVTLPVVFTDFLSAAASCTPDNLEGGRLYTFSIIARGSGGSSVATVVRQSTAPARATTPSGWDTQGLTLARCGVPWLR